MNAGYSRSQIWLHWASVLLLLVAFASHEVMQAAWRAANQGGTYATPILHIAAGLGVLGLVVARLWMRRHGQPAAPQDTPAWMHLVARLTHAGLYLLMVLIPATGAAAWFGGIHDAGEIHEVLFTLGLALVGLHVAAALFHQLVKRDGLLLRMWRPAPGGVHQDSLH